MNAASELLTLLGERYVGEWVFSTFMSREQISPQSKCEDLRSRFNLRADVVIPKATARPSTKRLAQGHSVSYILRQSGRRAGRVAHDYGPKLCPWFE